MPSSVCRKSPYTNEWDSKGTVFLWQSPETESLAGLGSAQVASGASQRVNFKTVQWTVLKEGTPCK